MDDIRDKISDICVPKALINKQDLRNIVHDFQLNSTRSHSSDAVSVDIWVQRVSTIADRSLNSVIYYTPQGETSDDVILVISNKFQREMLIKFGSNIVCIVRFLLDYAFSS